MNYMLVYRFNPCFKLVKTDYDMSRKCTFCYDCNRNSVEEMGQSEPNSGVGPNFRISIVGNV